MSDSAPFNVRAVPLHTLFGRPEVKPAPARAVEEERDIADILLQERAIGRAEGEATAMHHAEAERDALIRQHEQALETVSATFEAAVHALHEELATHLADLVMKGVEAVLGALPAIPEETLQTLVLDAIAAAPAEGTGRIYVHPDLISQVDGVVKSGFRLEADQALAIGEVRVDVDAAQFTSSLQIRLDRLGQMLRGEA